MILIVDNYDSFVQNLARYVREEGHETYVVRNDAIRMDDHFLSSAAGVIISPGPKRPVDAGMSMGIIKRLAPHTPLLGVCLGHQCLVETFGGETLRARHPLHGEASEVTHEGTGIFRHIPSPMMAGRYHSLRARPMEKGPLRASAWSSDGELMAVEHETRPWFGVQFHPESLLTPHGRIIMKNFLQFCKSR